MFQQLMYDFSGLLIDTCFDQRRLKIFFDFGNLR